MRARELLTAEERLSYIEIPNNIDDTELAIYFTLTAYDIEFIQQHRNRYNRIGLGVQLCFLRYNGWSIMELGIIPDKISEYLSQQLSIDNEGQIGRASCRERV